MSPAEAAIKVVLSHYGDDPRVEPLRTLLSELDALRAATRLCERHKPSGGTRSTCLVCAGEKLTAALSRIDYLCGPPNEMKVSTYDCFYEEGEVVKAVERLLARHQEREVLLRESRLRLSLITGYSSKIARDTHNKYVKTIDDHLKGLPSDEPR